jgi:hypothetical protein
MAARHQGIASVRIWRMGASGWHGLRFPTSLHVDCGP